MRDKLFAGVDEVGRGCLAGPVVSCVVILKKSIKKSLLKDSKMIPFKDRLVIADHIKKNSWFSIGLASVNEIDKFNIFNASLLSMERAIKKLKKKPDIFLIDGTHAPKKINNFRTIVKGDQKIKCISAASIIAKAYRDLYMIRLSNKYPKYKWNKNFGYGTSQHLSALKKFGVTNYHRRSYKPVHNILSK
ncbi:MAG: ribonuclease HII [Candidatus Marinimicrobia bacterium]|nr:ribonuclease HII [Candidatus Neomarinimicrobiota bacterium]|tara:strand:- start:188 stop:757 length:570 start_codon:yes stop_codon:yes gene_type:complete